MRLSQQRTPVGRSTEAEARLTVRTALHPTQQLFVTPATEVAALCRLTLMRYLENCDLDLAVAAEAHLDGCTLPGNADRYVQTDVWTRLLVALQRITILDPACGEAHLLVGMCHLLDRLIHHANHVIGRKENAQTRRRAIVGTNLFGIEAQSETMDRAWQNLVCAAHGEGVRCRTPVTPNLSRADGLVEHTSFQRAEQYDSIRDAGGFHVVLGNPPFVRHEYIADPLGVRPDAAYKRLVFESVQARLDAYLECVSGGTARILLNRRSDLSLLFTVFGLSLLRPGGVLGFVVPTALSSAQYGAPLWRLLSCVDLTAQLQENLSRRIFAEAAVNTALLIVSRDVCAPLTSAVHRDTPTITAPNRGRARAEVSCSSAPLERLRNRIEERCTSLGSIGRLRYPIKTGLNRFFYPDEATRARFQIESRFLLPVLKSPRDIETLVPLADTVRAVLFRCPYSLEQLAEAHMYGALSYIAWGAEQTRPAIYQKDASDVPWPRVPSLRGRDPWYAVPVPTRAHILCPRFLHRRFFFALPEEGILEDQTFYGLELPPPLQQQLSLVGALLNSSITFLMMETRGRTGLGDGVRQYALRDMSVLPIPDLKRLNAVASPRLTHAFARLASRAILSIEDEVVQSDRVEMDALVCASLGLTESDGAAAREQLTTLVNRRLERAKCR